MRKEEIITTRSYSFTVVFEPALEGGYTAICPALPGLVTEGDTLEEARAMAVDAIHAYLESLRKDGIPLPVEEEPVEPVRERVTVELEMV